VTSLFHSTLTDPDSAPRRPATVRHVPYLYLLLECDRPLAGSTRHELSGLGTVELGRGDARRILRTGESGEGKLELQLPDGLMSSAHARLTRIVGRWVIEDLGSKNGTVLNGEPQRRAVLSHGDLFQVGHSLFTYREGLPLQEGVAPDLDSSVGSAPLGLGTLSPALAQHLVALQDIARSTVPVLIQGETGTGKELIARAAHAVSGRPGSYVAVNCGAIPANLVETELFGYRKGAFSGADEDRPGLIRASDKGTLFLDEIGDLPLSSQAAFLRVLQEKEVLPIGATKPVPVDVRLVSATHRDLEALVEAGKFRSDLLARLSGFTVRLPPLRERREDLGLMLATLLPRTGMDLSRVTFKCDAVRALYRYEWPLNVRELEKTLMSALVLSGGGAVGSEHFPETLRALLSPSEGATLSLRKTATPAVPPPPVLGPEDAVRREQLIALLTEHSGNITSVAKAMGKARMQVQRWLKRFQLDASQYRK
jgi:sigma-54 dependent transcriptional regulator, acetoin dehydrogenase operon transcriptional activator AcoR